MGESLKIVGGKVFYNGGFVEATVVAEEGKISFIGKETKSPQADETIDAKGKLVIPGAIDVHVHFRDPGFTWKEDFYTGSASAAAGGVTTILDMPNTDPPTNTLNAIIDKIELGEKKSIIDFSLHVGLPKSPHILCDLPVIGVPSVKIYSYYHSSLDRVREYIEYASKRNLKVIFTIHAESKEEIEKAKEKWYGINKDMNYFYETRKPEAEIVEVKKYISLANELKHPIHFAHVSTKQAFEEIVKAKQRGLPITFEVTPHHIYLELEEKTRSPYYKVHPPLRDKSHREYILENLEKVDMFASDHAPHTISEKNMESEDIDDVAPGFPGVETLVPLIMALAYKGLISYEEAVKKITENPATTFGLNGKGFLVEGYDADIVIFDPKKEWVIKTDKLHSKAGHTPYEGMKVRGYVETTIVRGKIVYDKGEVIGEKGWGRYIRAWRATW